MTKDKIKRIEENKALASFLPKQKRYSYTVKVEKLGLWDEDPNFWVIRLYPRNGKHLNVGNYYPSKSTAEFVAKKLINANIKKGF